MVYIQPVLYHDSANFWCWVGYNGAALPQFVHISTYLTISMKHRLCVEKNVVQVLRPWQIESKPIWDQLGSVLSSL